VDTAIRQHRSFSPHDPLPEKIQVYGRGGTTFTEPFKWVEENLRDDRPQALIYLTDMYGNFPANRPDYPVIWCATSDQEAPFPETIHLPVTP
jgi:predicted metal-dependent peptidase